MPDKKMPISTYQAVGTELLLQIVTFRTDEMMQEGAITTSCRASRITDITELLGLLPRRCLSQRSAQA